MRVLCLAVFAERDSQRLNHKRAGPRLENVVTRRSYQVCVLLVIQSKTTSHWKTRKDTDMLTITVSLNRASRKTRELDAQKHQGERGLLSLHWARS